MTRDRLPRLTERGWEVPLTRGLTALVDEADLPLIAPYTWSASCHGARSYARTRSGDIYMHRLLVQPTAGLEVDHVNGDTLDNRRANLRPANHVENARNRRANARQTYSRFKGVSWFKATGRWQAGIVVANRRRHLGYFDSEVQAALAYDEAARELHGAFALTNADVFPVLSEAAS